MVPCCDTSAEYIDDQGTISSKWLEARYGVGAEVIKMVDETSEFAQWVYKKHGYYPEEHKVKTVDGTLHKLCVCACHQYNSMVMH